MQTRIEAKLRTPNKPCTKPRGKNIKLQSNVNNTGFLEDKKVGANKKCKRNGVEQSLAMQIYLDSLALTGRRSMLGLLEKGVRYLGWEMGAHCYPYHEFGYKQMQEIKTCLQKNNYACSTVNQALAAFRGVMTVMFNLGLIGGNTLMRIKSVKKANGSRLPVGRSLSSKEIKAIVAACEEHKNIHAGCRNKSTLLVLIFSGMRCSELRKLMLEDVNLKTGEVIVRSGKGNKDRRIFLAEPAKFALQKWIDCLNKDSGYVFTRVLKNGEVQTKPLSSQGITSILNDIAKQAKVDKFRPHDCRVTFISKLLASGTCINTTRLLAGHEQVATTLAYQRNNDSVQRQASQAIKF